MPRYRVVTADNFHYMDDDERHEHGTYDTSEEALAACRAIVETSVKAQLEPGMSAEALFKRYQDFGNDPFILVIDGRDDQPVSSEQVLQLRRRPDVAVRRRLWGF